jgi:SAM-dependent methyltransferase
VTPQIQAWMKGIRTKVPFASGQVLEIGSHDVNGTVRQFFEDATEYTGIDMTPGPGVDLVLNAEALLDHFGDESFDTILCCEMLEHDILFLHTVHEIHMMLKPGGMLIITTPTFGFPLHRFPKDYWRFGEDAYREIFFKGFHIFNLMFLDDTGTGERLERVTLAAIGKKP